MEYLWTWGGQFFGYRQGGRLYTHRGLHVGNFSGDDVFDLRGRYLGELQSNDRLIRNPGKRGHVSGASARYAGTPIARKVNYVGYAMYARYEDFSSPETFA